LVDLQADDLSMMARHWSISDQKLTPSDKPRVSIVIPTLNASATLPRCIESIRRQSFKEVEVIVVDSNSTDGTAHIAEGRARVITIESSMTEARLVGARQSRGEFVFNLDSDQYLEPHAILSALQARSPIVAFGEVSDGGGLVAKINRLDLSSTQSAWKDNIDPLRGQIRPRFYKRELLLQALEEIPPKILNLRPSPFSEDSLIFYNAYRREPAVAFVPNAIHHDVSLGLVAYMKKWHRYGVGARAYKGTPYEILIAQRGSRRGNGLGRLASVPALVTRGVPFALGYYA
jgi:glycosyltransferase involved in cell wall biosynthesis